MTHEDCGPGKLRRGEQIFYGNQRGTAVGEDRSKITMNLAQAVRQRGSVLGPDQTVVD
jgi:hypothetical protein